MRDLPRRCLSSFRKGSFISCCPTEECVRKVFLPPWNIEDIVEGVKASMDEAYIHMDLVRRINELSNDEKEFSDTLERLKVSLLRQQYSYNKIAPFFNRVLDAFLKRRDLDPYYVDFVKKSCDKMLRLQTISKFRVSDLKDIISENITGALKNNPGVTLGEVKSCLYGEVPRFAMADLTFSLWLLAVVESYKCEKAVLEVDSRYVTSRKCEYRLTVTGTKKTDAPVDIQVYIANILGHIIDEYQKYDTGDGWTYELRITL